MVHNTVDYLVIGTGKACAWQSSAKLELLGFMNMLILESVEKVGGFEPIGSANKYPVLLNVNY